MTKLYEISQELVRVHDALEEGSSSEELEKRLDELQIGFENKVEAVCRFIRNVEGEKAAIDAEVQRLDAKSRARNNLILKLRRYLSSNMAATGIDKVRGALFSVSTHDSKPAVNVVNLSDVPNEFLYTYAETRVDKGLILKHFQETGEIPKGVEITQGKTLRIS